MGDKPILFSGPMVRALLNGRKAQTRRVLNRSNVTVLGERWGRNAPWSGLRFSEAWARERHPIFGHHVPHLAVPFCHPGDEPTPSEDCGIYRVTPVVGVGDRLWARETWALRGDRDPMYAADWKPSGMKALRPWRPSIFMPRWASRLTLIVTDVRVQRVQDISEQDAIAEGCGQYASSTELVGAFDPARKGSYREGYRELWDSLNAARGYGWAENPWVAAISFEVKRQNIDALAEAA